MLNNKETDKFLGTSACQKVDYYDRW